MIPESVQIRLLVFENNVKVIGTDLINRVNRYEINNFYNNPHWFRNKFGYKPKIILTNPPFDHIDKWINLGYNAFE